MVILSLMNIVIVLLGLLSISSNRRIESLLGLIGMLVCMSMVLVSLGLEVIGLIVIILYVGAVSIMVMFIVVMLDDNEIRERSKIIWLIVSILLLLGVLNVGLSNNEELNLEEIVYLRGEMSSMGLIGVYIVVERIYEILCLGLMLIVGLIGGVRLR